MMSDQAVVAPEPGRSPLARLLHGYSVEVTARGKATAELCAEHFPPGTTVYIARIPGDGAGQSVALAAQLRRRGFVPVPHIAARGITGRAALDDVLGRLAGEAGVSAALLIGGDIRALAGPYGSGLDLLRTGSFQTHGIARLGLPWYPEGHPTISDQDIRAALLAKAAYLRTAGLEGWLVSQFCFAASPYIARARQIRALGVDLPLIVGIAGPASRLTLIRYAIHCGIGNSVRFLQQGALADKLAGHMIRPEAPETLLTEIAAMQQASLVSFAGTHVFTFGGIAGTARWAREVAARA